MIHQLPLTCPTPRSADLAERETQQHQQGARLGRVEQRVRKVDSREIAVAPRLRAQRRPARAMHHRVLAAPQPADEQQRSEEHTSELQSLNNLVCSLLIEQ